MPVIVLTPIAPVWCSTASIACGCRLVRVLYYSCWKFSSPATSSALSLFSLFVSHQRISPRLGPRLACRFGPTAHRSVVRRFAAVSCRCRWPRSRQRRCHSVASSHGTIQRSTSCPQLVNGLRSHQGTQRCLSSALGKYALQGLFPTSL